MLNWKLVIVHPEERRTYTVYPEDLQGAKRSGNCQLKIGRGDLERLVSRKRVFRKTETFVPFKEHTPKTWLIADVYLLGFELDFGSACTLPFLSSSVRILTTPKTGLTRMRAHLIVRSKTLSPEIFRQGLLMNNR